MYPSATDDSNGSTVLIEPKVFVFSREFYTEFSRKYSISCIKDYKAIRDILSVSSLGFEKTLASVLRKELDALLKDNFDILALGDDRDDSLNVMPDRAAEIRLSTAMAESETTVATATAYLRYKKDNEADVTPVADCFNIDPPSPGITKNYYTVLTHGYDIYIIVEEGILSQLEGLPFRLNFLRAVLKALYSLARIHNVNRGSWYRSYIGVLSTSVGL